MTPRDKRIAAVIVAAATLSSCGDGSEPAVSYGTAVVERGDLAVVVEASGTIEPISSVEVKSKASGEILELGAEIGDSVAAGELLVRIDPRTPRNHVAQTEAAVAAAAARLATARAQLTRGDKLRGENWINDAEYEALELAVANARAEEIAARVALENARIALEDTEVRAKAPGIILTRLVEPGQVISSPTQDVGGGTPLLTMADLRRVRARVRVDETDIGKLAAEIPARIRVSAYPGRIFGGVIEKIEPQAVIDQNVTLFAVLIHIENGENLLRPGMNVDVVFDVARREGVLTLPLMALRARRDIDVTAEILGVDAGGIRRQLAVPAENDGRAPRARGANGGALQLDDGLWAVVVRDGAQIPTAVETGITDLDRVEITGGLGEGDQVLLLPTTSLVEIQRQIQDRSSLRSGVPGLTPRPETQPPARRPES
jgi:HlyD family secretion protein